jgi:predicted nuclease of predicted toxin-antitoxin system
VLNEYGRCMSWRFLIDACLPGALARGLDAAGYPAIHVFDLGMARDEDIDIWRLAATRGEVVVSKDADFAMFAVSAPTTQAVVWLRMGNTRKQALIGRMLAVMPDVTAALAAGEKVIEVR